MLSGTLRISFKTVSTFRRRSCCAFALSASFAKESGASASIPIITTVHLFLIFMMFPSQNKIAFDLNTRNASHWPRAFLDAGIRATSRPNEELINKWSGLRQIGAELFLGGVLVPVIFSQ